MSTISVSRITSGDVDTPLIFTTGNTTSGSIKVEAANAEVVLFGVARITGGLISNGVDILTSFGSVFDQANTAEVLAETSFSQANLVFGVANTGFGVANLGFSHANAAFSAANNAASTGKAIAMAIVFG